MASLSLKRGLPFDANGTVILPPSLPSGEGVKPDSWLHPQFGYSDEDHADFCRQGSLSVRGRTGMHSRLSDRLHSCVCACVHVYMRVYMRVHVCMCVRACVCTCACVRVYVVRVYVCTYVCVCVHLLF